METFETMKKTMILMTLLAPIGVGCAGADGEWQDFGGTEPEPADDKPLMADVKWSEPVYKPTLSDGTDVPEEALAPLMAKLDAAHELGIELDDYPALANALEDPGVSAGDVPGLVSAMGITVDKHQRPWGFGSDSAQNACQGTWSGTCDIPDTRGFGFRSRCDEPSPPAGCSSGGYGIQVGGAISAALAWAEYYLTYQTDYWSGVYLPWNAPIGNMRVTTSTSCGPGGCANAGLSRASYHWWNAFDDPRKYYFCEVTIYRGALDSIADQAGANPSQRLRFAQNVTRHEAGHCFGLGHTTAAGTLMGPANSNHFNYVLAPTSQEHALMELYVP
jgi:hypothetical protein